MYTRAFIYNALIDPLLKGLRKTVTSQIQTGISVIDIACGTGSLAIDIAGKAGTVTGIDLDSSLISFAQNQAIRKNIDNTTFLVKDAADLHEFEDRQFDIAVTSMAVHQFDEALAILILKEMTRISRKIIIADYNFPVPRNMAGYLSRSIEALAGGDHFRNYRNFVKKGGLSWFAAEAGISLSYVALRGYGTFTVAVSCS